MFETVENATIDNHLDLLLSIIYRERNIIRYNLWLIVRLIGYFVLWHINSRELSNAKSLYIRGAYDKFPDFFSYGYF